MRRAGFRSAGGLVAALALVGGVLSSAQPLRAGAAGATATAEGTTTAIVTAAWAWLVVRHPTNDDVKGPGTYAGNSSGGMNFVDHQGLGQYLVTFNGVPADHGNVLVSTLGRQPKICSPVGWTRTSEAELVEVRCFTRVGAPANGTFVINWVSAAGIGGKFAYGLNASPTSNCGMPIEQYVSNGGEIFNCPVTNGVARLKIDWLGSDRGTVQVTTFGKRAGEDEASPGVCAALDFYPHDAGPGIADSEWVDVKCFEPDGTWQIYRQHDVWFMQGLGMKGIDRSNVAYVFANRPSASSYTPNARYSYSSADGTNTVTRVGVGRYVVKLRGMPPGGSAQVTAFIESSTARLRHCVVGGIETSDLPQRVRVRCFNKGGDLVDTAFTLAYAR